ncbi:ABC transporter substrate-binding protein [Spiribacter roseus]|uniref:ABC transporter substrate-binding protein n=1 Tax=Spiribacter roseus TaxID=1855875 RepID=A0ABV3S0S1_9GAMM
MVGRSIRRSLAGLLLPAALSLAMPVLAAEDTPQRVVSMNLCTDQLAMLVAGPEQLISVSSLSQDPANSAMADRARQYPVNHGRAEEIHVLEPDQVIAGRFSATTTVAMLRRLDIPVAVFEPAISLDDVRDNLRRMGEVLGRSQRAEALVRQFDRRLDAIRAARTPVQGADAALFFPNGYTRGEETLIGDIVETAGFDNVASDLGVARGAMLPLERLVMAGPNRVITASRGPGYSRSEAIMQHPVLEDIAPFGVHRGLGNADWVCGTPHVLDAVERMASLLQRPAGEPSP